ncbi:nucleoside recognition domain-containing protein [Desulfitibacter alkalitolerans]|uniref:nucleoside recognition domain-containing protein n=1 Tax=Desulfitibacter alkalitolerans TaxID=264641 RepID=UPI0004842826|nr:nucleoside recognition domain-containing protein [Desulfitibacter alkalitolerans]
MEFVLETAANGLFGSLRSVAKIAMIVIPIMVFIEILKAYSVLEKIYFVLEPLLKLFRLPREAALPLMAGLIFGITFGAGLIIQAVREGHLSGKDIVIVNVFLALCHSLIEDTFLFVVLGASAVTLISVRLIFALIITFILARYYDGIMNLAAKIKANKTKNMQQVNKG